MSLFGLKSQHRPISTWPIFISSWIEGIWSKSLYELKEYGLNMNFVYQCEFH